MTDLMNRPTDPNQPGVGDYYVRYDDVTPPPPRPPTGGNRTRTGDAGRTANPQTAHR